MRQRQRVWIDKERATKFARENYESLNDKYKDTNDGITKKAYCEHVRDALSAYLDFVFKEDDRTSDDAWKAFEGRLFTEAAWYEFRREVEKTGVRQIEKYLRPFFLDKIQYWKNEYNKKVDELQKKQDEIEEWKQLLFRVCRLDQMELTEPVNRGIRKFEFMKGQDAARYELTGHLRTILKNHGIEWDDFQKEQDGKTHPTKQREEGRTRKDLEEQYPILGHFE